MLENIKNVSSEIIDELVRGYKMNYARKIIQDIIKTILTRENLSRINLNQKLAETSINIDIKKLLNVDYSKNKKKKLFIDQSNPNTYVKYYNYNYKSSDEMTLCYRNNSDIINYLLNESSTNYLIRDQQQNSILHYLVNIENFMLFNKIYSDNKSIFDKMKNFKNMYNKTPIEIIKEKINFNNKNFYKYTPVNKISRTELLYSDRYSEDLNTLLKNKNDMKNIPLHITNIFNDMYFLFNLNDSYRLINNPLLILKNNYDDIYNQYKKSINKITDPSKFLFDPNQDISDGTNIFILKKYKQNKTMAENQYHKRFYNTIVHVFTLHFTTVFYDLVTDLLRDNNPSVLGIDNFKQFKKNIFLFDPVYENPNLAQKIILDIFKTKYSDTVVENKSLGGLKEILKYEISVLNTLMIPSRKKEIDENLEKLYDYMVMYYDTFNKQLSVFLNGYVKFIQLQYNLQKIRSTLETP